MQTGDAADEDKELGRARITVAAAELLRRDLPTLLVEQGQDIDTALGEALTGAGDDPVTTAARIWDLVQEDPVLATRLRAHERALQKKTVEAPPTHRGPFPLQPPPGDIGAIAVTVWTCPLPHTGLCPVRERQWDAGQDMGTCPHHAGVRLVPETTTP